MIVEPAPTSPRSPLRRGLWLAGLALPPVLLVVVVAAGVLGSSPPEPALADSSAQPVASATAGPADTDGDRATPDPGTLPDGLPASIARLAVVRPSEVVAARTSGPLPDAVAVAGYLAVAGAGTRCVDGAPDPPGEWCARTAVLFETPRELTGDDVRSGPLAHLHATIPIGVRAPEPVGRPGSTNPDEARAAVPVVAIMRLADDAPCGGVERRCDHGFVIDRIAWSDGAQFPLVPLLEPTLEVAQRLADPFAATISDHDLPLQGLLVRTSTVARLEPAAAAAVAERPANEPVWFLRMVGWQVRGPDVRGPSVYWLLLDDRRRVIALGVPAGGVLLAAAGVTRTR